MPYAGRFTLLSAFLVLALTSPASGSQRLTVSSTRHVPDWRISYEENVPPLTFMQVAKTIDEVFGGPRLANLRVTSAPWDAGDRRLLTTISPNGDGMRDAAVVRFHLAEPITLTMTVMACSKHGQVVAVEKADLPAGDRRMVWAPPPKTLPRTYLLLLRATAKNGGGTRAYGNADYRLAELNPAPVVRVQGVTAGFTARNYAAGAAARLRITTDASSFRLQFFHAGPESEPTTGNEMEGVPVSEPRLYDWSSYRSAPGTLELHIGGWRNGIYFAKLTASDGRVGFAPFVVRPDRYGVNRVAYIVHTNTWEAYNHQDVDGEGWGDTWYAENETQKVDLSRPYIRLGAPPKWRNYDVTPLHWIYSTGKQVDFIGDEDLERFTSAELTRLYDLIVFPGHEEYVTTRVYDLIAGYRNLGGNLMFLAATNLLWRVDRHGNSITRVAQWRQLGRPESRLVGVQYRGNDEGEHRGPFELTPFGQSSWEFAGVDQSQLEHWPWFGIEFDKTTSASPAGIHVLGQVNPHMLDSGLRGQMTYYERGSAKVFASGILNFPSAAYYSPYRQVLENVWARLSKP